MKTYAPKSLHGEQLRELLTDLHATPLEVCKFLKVGERTFRRWLADDSCPWPILALLWHETPAGREAAHLDTGNALNLALGLSRSTGEALAKESARLARVLAISDTGAANDPLLQGPPGGGGAGFPRRPAQASTLTASSATRSNACRQK